MKKESVVGFLFLLVFSLGFVSAFDNLCLDDVGWDVSVVHSPGSPAECPSISNSPDNVNDGDQNTVSMGCRMNDNYDYPVEITFPSVVPLITRVSYNYSSILAYKSYPSVPGAYSKIELFSEGAWVEAVGCVVLYEGNSVIPYIGGIDHPRAREECVGSWSNVEKIRLTFSAQYGCCPSDPGPFAGYVFLEEVGAYDDASAAINCSGYSFPLADVEDAKRLYRFQEVAGPSHFYTTSKNEAVKMMTTYYPSFAYEGVSGYAYDNVAGGKVPLYRFYNNLNGMHIYTIDEFERALLDANLDWTSEGVEGYVYPCSIADTLSFQHYFNTSNFNNFYTTNDVEKNRIDTSPFAPWNQYQNMDVECYLGDYGYSDESQIITSLNGSDGALASLWNYGDFQMSVPGYCYGINVVCNGLIQATCNSNPSCTWEPSYNVYKYPMHRIYYDEIFGVHYNDTNPHVCDGNNKVIGLSSNGYSLVEVPTAGAVDVCYGDLRCEEDLSVGDSCVNGGEVVLRLSASSSAYASDPSSSDPVKICCKMSSPPIPSGPSVLEWKDMSGNDISIANLGDSVRMVMTNSLTGEFEVWEEDVWPNADDPIRVDDDVIPGVVEGSDIRGVWTITEEDFGPGKTIDHDDFYFKIEGAKSSYLAVDLDEEDEPMTVNIIAPSCGMDFDEGDTVTIDVVAADDDDLIDGTVTVDGFVVPFSNGGVTFDYTFNTPGNHQVVVEAINTRGKRNRDIASVMVLDRSGASYVDGIYVAACIDKPKDFSDISGSIVEFDATGTKGIKVVAGVPSDFLPGSQYLDFYWSFFPDGRKYGEKYAGTGNSLAYDFITEFAISGDNSAVLRVELN